jgi:hypothetical protein
MASSVDPTELVVPDLAEKGYIGMLGEFATLSFSRMKRSGMSRSGSSSSLIPVATSV